MFLKNLQNGSLKRISTLLFVAEQQGTLMKTQLGSCGGAVFSKLIPTYPVPVHHMEMFYNLAAEPDRGL